jgi:hypothetical protein
MVRSYSPCRTRRSEVRTESRWGSQRVEHTVEGQRHFSQIRREQRRTDDLWWIGRRGKGGGDTCSSLGGRKCAGRKGDGGDEVPPFIVVGGIKKKGLGGRLGRRPHRGKGGGGPRPATSVRHDLSLATVGIGRVGQRAARLQNRGGEAADKWGHTTQYRIQRFQMNSNRL